jgi:hypothetical protein
MMPQRRLGASRLAICTQKRRIEELVREHGQDWADAAQLNADEFQAKHVAQLDEMERAWALWKREWWFRSGGSSNYKDAGGGLCHHSGTERRRLQDRRRVRGVAERGHDGRLSC